VEPDVGLIYHDGGLDTDPVFIVAASEDAEASQGETAV
jgi:hypothetical protein